MTGRQPFFRPHLAFSRAAPRAASPPAAQGDAVLTPEQAHQFRELVLPHLDAAYNLARYLARDPNAAEDIVQEAFLRAFRAFATYRGGPPKAWLFAIVRNCFLTWAASQRSGGGVLVEEAALSERDRMAVAEAADPDQDTPGQALLRNKDAEVVRTVIGNLPEPFRETLVLREMDELSYKEIAGLTGAPIGTVMSRLARARQMLADVLLPRQDQSGPAQQGNAQS